ncbi:MAG: transcriptional regulator [Candidatus Wallbacteria bacterium HGW-Wallbacteria-1]|jgi:TrpR family trp operon transcriptional repressor|uniref:Transcriptional regulator n=1 Tax=Candidatus Wallbacteria bacterium HGW-Wallbacteria-1 TaxID=2013854 RepID=A0A2N1PNV9_9BACT|nr:MAG: transcriptional regulator [Candidatus Wallbacteria bacterium HGW-Wallbacteria-1]
MKDESLIELSTAMASISDSGEMARFLSEIHTQAELKDMVLRWRLMIMLREGVSQRGIASSLGISLCKITRGSKILKRKNSVTAELLVRRDRAMSREKNENEYSE